MTLKDALLPILISVIDTHAFMSVVLPIVCHAKLLNEQILVHFEIDAYLNVNILR